jgi:uncharacterized protein (DUF362 family)
MSSECYPPVAVTLVNGYYPEEFPFNPDEEYPEYQGKNIASKPNYVYRAVRESLKNLGYDREHYDTKQWNPLGSLITPGDRVFIKPNLVAHEYRQSCPCKGDLYSVITHPSVVRAVADYAAIALAGQGEIVIGDNPSIDADFSKLNAATNLKACEDFYRDNLNIKCRVLDLRKHICPDLKYYGFKSKMKQGPGDPEGDSIINLGKQSLLYGLNPLLFRGIYSKRWQTIKHHHGSRHEYCISNTILNSNVYISIPKLKAHRKVGATLNIKGLVGINSDKNFLIHWRIGYPKMGGDEFPNPERWRDLFGWTLRHIINDLTHERMYYWMRSRTKGTPLFDFFQTETCPSGRKHRGAWEGNDTCWRMATDLYNLFVKDLSGLRQKKGFQTKTFSVVDGVLAGEGDGPFCPSSKEGHIIVAGQDLLLVDCVGVRLMDFNLEEIRYLKHLIKDNNIDLKQVRVISEDLDVDDFFDSDKSYLKFKPPTGWNRLAVV